MARTNRHYLHLLVDDGKVNIIPKINPADSRKNGKRIQSKKESKGSILARSIQCNSRKTGNDPIRCTDT